MTANFKFLFSAISFALLIDALYGRRQNTPKPARFVRLVFVFGHRDGVYVLFPLR